MASGHRVSAAVSGTMRGCWVSITHPEWVASIGDSGRVVNPVPDVSNTRALVTPRSGCSDIEQRLEARHRSLRPVALTVMRHEEVLHVAQ